MKFKDFYKLIKQPTTVCITEENTTSLIKIIPGEEAKWLHMYGEYTVEFIEIHPYVFNAFLITLR